MGSGGWLAEPLVSYEDGEPQPMIAIYWMPWWAMEWRRFIFWLNPCSRRPWRLWYWTGLCRLWGREAEREESYLIPVLPEWADEHFDWEWSGNE